MCRGKNSSNSVPIWRCQNELSTRAWKEGQRLRRRRMLGQDTDLPYLWRLSETHLFCILHTWNKYALFKKKIAYKLSWATTTAVKSSIWNTIFQTETLCTVTVKAVKSTFIRFGKKFHISPQKQIRHGFGIFLRLTNKNWLIQSTFYRTTVRFI